MESIPSTPEHLAIGETAELYQEIKDTLRVPVVNLVWRHLATIDGALGLVWKCIKPLYLDGGLDVAADSLRSMGGLPKLPRWSRSTLATVGVSSCDETILQAVLANYDQSNPRNLIALMALRAKLNSEPARPVSVCAPRSEKREAITLQLPRLIPANEMSLKTQSLAQSLNRIGTSNTSIEIVAGVPRHLAHWPGFLALCTEALLPLDSDIKRGIATVQYEAQQSGRSLISTLGEFDAISESQNILLALDLFTSKELIANYIVKVRMLLKALPE